MRISPTQTTATRLRSERGMALIHVGVSIFVLMGFSAFVLDYGVLMLSRGQAQNVADMAALAGGIARAIDEPTQGNPAVGGPAQLAIQASVLQHTIFGGTPENTGLDWKWFCPVGIDAWCVKVDVFRDGTNNSTTLPVFFAALLGTTSQKIRATATAAAVPANGSRCMKPWLIPNNWDEKSMPPDSTYNPTVPGNPVAPTDDIYRPYDYVTNDPGSGYTHDDFPTAITLRPGDPNQIRLGDLYEFVDAMESQITNCEIVKAIGEHAEVVAASAVTMDSVSALLLASGPFDAVVGLFSPAELDDMNPAAKSFPLQVVNMMNIRITGIDLAGNEIHGVLTGGIGDLLDAGQRPLLKGSLIKKVHLVR